MENLQLHHHVCGGVIPRHSLHRLPEFLGGIKPIVVISSVYPYWLLFISPTAFQVLPSNPNTWFAFKSLFHCLLLGDLKQTNSSSNLSCGWVRNFHWHQVQTLVQTGICNLFHSWSRNSFSVSVISWYSSHIIKSNSSSKSISLCRQTSVDLKTFWWKVEVNLISCVILISSFCSNKYIELFVYSYVLHIVYVLIKICESVNVHCLLEN